MDHEILLKKLRAHGLSPNLIQFFHSYLCDRIQAVLFNGRESKSFTVFSSVPQGSNLGPLLFLIMINDLPPVMNMSSPFLFAD